MEQVGLSVADHSSCLTDAFNFKNYSPRSQKQMLPWRQSEQKSLDKHINSIKQNNKKTKSQGQRDSTVRREEIVQLEGCLPCKRLIWVQSLVLQTLPGVISDNKSQVNPE